MSKHAVTRPGQRQSAIIALCVKYCQLLGAYDAGFAADPTGNSDFAGTGRHFQRGVRILTKLVALNPHLQTGADPLNAMEVRAMAAVMQSLYGLRKGDELTPEELTFIAFFAGCVADHLDYSGRPAKLEGQSNAPG